MKIDASKAELPELQQKYCDSLNTKLSGFTELGIDAENCWNHLQKAIHQSSIDTLGRRKCLDPDWYRESRDTIDSFFEKKHAAMLKMKSRFSRASLAASLLERWLKNSS